MWPPSNPPKGGKVQIRFDSLPLWGRPEGAQILKFMEKLVSIISQGAHSQRQFNGKDGQPTVFHYMDFVLTDGIDTFHAQATGNLAQALQPLDPNVLHMVQCHISHRTFDRTDKRTGEVTVGHENVIYIDRIV